MSETRYDFIKLSMVPIDNKIWESFYTSEIDIEDFSEILDIELTCINRYLNHTCT